MALSLLKTGTSVGYGAVDIAIDYFDPSPHGSFKGATDWSRVVATAAGIGLNVFTKKKTLNDFGEALELSAIPLLEKSVVNFILRLTGKGTVISGGFGESQGQITIRRPGTGSAPGGVPGIVF